MLLALSGCDHAVEGSSRNDDPASTGHNTSTDLDHRVGEDILGTWELHAAESSLTEIEDEGGLIRVTFLAASVSGVASCTPFSGTYEIHGNTLRFIEIAATAEDCGDWVADAFFSAENLEVLVIDQEWLVLSSPGWRLEFKRATAS